MKDDKPRNPAEIAREAFRQLASRQIAPTPDAYREVYDTIAGVTSPASPLPALGKIASNIIKLPGELSALGRHLQKSVDASNWDEFAAGLAEVIEYLRKQSAPTAGNTTAQPATTVPLTPQVKLLRELLNRTLSFSLSSLLSGQPELANEAATLGDAIRDAANETEVNEIGTRIKQFCYRIELKSGEIGEQQEMLLRMFRLLLENVAFLLDDDSWLRGQFDAVQKLIDGPINHRALEDASQSLKEVIYRQGTLKDSLSEAKATVRNMITLFIDQLGSMASSTDDYHGKIEVYSQKISKASNISELNVILSDVMRDTRTIQAEALQSRDHMLNARREVEAAEARIHALESQLAEISALASHDQLTSSLNRRGLDDAIQREQARAERQKTPLSVALLDLDDFKRLNDEYGHDAGDEALIHVVRIIRDTMRSMDVVGRFGGEEFVVLLPDTSAEEAVSVVARLQKELTKRIFMYNNQKLFITFSAGVATRADGEDMADTLKRADSAMYAAKKSGKNRVVQG